MEKYTKIIVTAVASILFGIVCFNQGIEAVKYKMHPYGIITCYLDKTENDLYQLSCEIDRDLKKYCKAFGEEKDMRCIFPDSISFLINGEYPHYINPIYSKEEIGSLEILVKISYLDPKKKQYNLVNNPEFEPVRIVINE